MPYDPVVDNRQRAPESPIGFFGRPVRDVERELRTMGAKPYSYAFGKYSKMTFSVYVITLSFDRKRRLGRVLVEPLPPFTQVEPKVQRLITELFLQGSDLGRFQTTFAREFLEISYMDPGKH